MCLQCFDAVGWASGRTSGLRAFSRAGPATWNALPDHIRTVADVLSSSENCSKHTILVKLLTFVDFLCVFLGVLAFGLLL